MASDAGTQVRTGRCAEHGIVRASREMPKPQWPFVVYLFRKVAASRAPFRCPECGQAVSDVERS